MFQHISTMHKRLPFTLVAILGLFLVMLDLGVAEVGLISRASIGFHIQTADKGSRGEAG